jgi:hypothetical protein
MGNPFDWADLVLDSEQKRKLLRFLIEIYKLKGTRQGVEATVFFLLGVPVRVIDYTSEGWILGVDELGNGSIAEVLSGAGGPFDFSSNRTLTIEMDSTPSGQNILFAPSDFSDPANGTAHEVVEVINSQIQGGGSYVVAAGTSAVYESADGPFSINPGESAIVEVVGELYEVTFKEGDFVVPGAGTPEEIAARFQAEIETIVATVDNAKFVLTTIHTGADAEIKFTGGSALAGLGITPGDNAVGTDAKRVSIYSSTSGTDSWVRVTGGDANDILEYDPGTSGGTGGAILAPDDAYTLYSFDIETETELDSETEAIIRRIAEYMKPAHTHLINIRTARPLPWPDGWVLGVSELDISTELID